MIKVKIDGYDVEGPAEEIALLLNSLNSKKTHVAGQNSHNELPDGDSMPPSFAKLVLTRRPLSTAQRKLLRLLLKRPSGWTPSALIMEELGMNGNQYGGLFGAIGRRVSNTDGYKEGYSLFEWHWDELEEESDCRLHPSALAAARDLSL